MKCLGILLILLTVSCAVKKTVAQDPFLAFDKLFNAANGFKINQDTKATIIAKLGAAAEESTSPQYKNIEYLSFIVSASDSDGKVHLGVDRKTGILFSKTFDVPEGHPWKDIKNLKEYFKLKNCKIVHPRWTNPHSGPSIYYLVSKEMHFFAVINVSDDYVLAFTFSNSELPINIAKNI